MDNFESDDEGSNSSLFKFKGLHLVKSKEDNEEYDKNVTDVVDNKLWVSRYSELNDKNGIMIKFNKERIINAGVKEQDYPMIEKQIIGGIQDLFHVISFGSSCHNKKLWDDYSDGYTGMAIEYKLEDVITSLKNPDYDVTWFENGKVVYNNEKLDLTSFVLELLNVPPTQSLESYNIPNMLTKDEIWKEEKEYRIVFSSEGHIGFELNDLRPSSIYVGYLKKTEDKMKLADYCKKNKIDIYEVRPNPLTNSTEAIISKIEW